MYDSQEYSLTFLDIIIGAPYEDDGRGAVYMYNGYSSGVWPKYSLRILGRNVDEGLFGFGASISNSMDMNRDNINGMFQLCAYSILT